MEIVKLRHPYKPEEIPAGDCVLVLGFFDGVHKGHQEVINRGKKNRAGETIEACCNDFQPASCGRIPTGSKQADPIPFYIEAKGKADGEIRRGRIV
jgi:hypothetical protein